jgi:hypothetical protein
MGNIILNDDLHISSTKLQSSNNIESISFYISKKYSNNNVYIAITDNRGIFDVIPLTYLRTETNYNIYCIDCKNTIRIKSGQCKIIFFIFDKELEHCRASNTYSLNINIENYSLFHQTYMTRLLSNDIVDIYDKISKMTAMNIEIYNEIKGVKDNEN